jgi:hypothetical protein
MLKLRGLNAPVDTKRRKMSKRSVDVKSLKVNRSIILRHFEHYDYVMIVANDE